MKAHAPLPGLKRLVEICQEHDLPLQLPPPLDSAPKAGESFFGLPFDPLLATVYQWTSDATLGDLYLERPGQEWDGLHGWNEWMRQHDTEPFRSCILFAGVPSLAYYFGTVPSLADPNGIQPVLYIDNHDEKFIVPVASSVDRLFDTYSRFCEAQVRDPEHVAGRFSGVHFPLTVPELIARDTPLVELLRAGRFDFLITPDEQTRKWVDQVLSSG